MQALFTHHAFVDLETTGLDPGVDEVIELGALFVEQGQVVERRERLFSSRAPLPLTIRRITGLTDEGRRDDVRDALACLRCEDPALLPMLAVLEGLEAECRRRPPALQLTESTRFLPAPADRARAGARSLAAADGATAAISPDELDAV